MKSQEFVSVYPKDVPEKQIFQGDYPDYIRVGQAASYKIGRFLHDVLSDRPPDSFTNSQEVELYECWTDNIPAMEKATLSDMNVGMKAWNELNFHSLNRNMFGLWTPLREGKWPSEKERIRAIDISQHFLALAGLTHYYDREKLKQLFQGTEAFFEPGVEREFGRFTGIIQEFDAGVVLMDVARHNPNLTVVPAPMQFEHTNPETNVDFLVIDFADKRAVGVQVKTRVRDEHIEKYDSERVVLIDGVVDLDNVQVMRVKKGTSKEEPKPWPGIISAKRVDAFKTVGKEAHLAAHQSRLMLNKKLLAKKLVGHLRVDYKRITSIISQRVLDKL